MKLFGNTVLLLLLLTTACCTTQRNTESRSITVSIPPLQYIVREIVGNDFDIEIIVPAGASPETYEPTPAQMMELERSRIVMALGLMDFERTLMEKLSERAEICDLSRGVKLLAGTCNHGHRHGTDPHIWMSPKQLRLIARNAYEAIAAAFPDSVRYTDNYWRLDSSIARLDSLVAAHVAASPHRSFITFHPVYTYYAADYGLTQIALESEGKEPSAARIKEVVEAARRDSLHTIVCQSHLSTASVETVASELGIGTVTTDPLSSDLPAEIIRITDIVTRR